MSDQQPSTLFEIDEFASLKNASFILNAMATKRGHGVAFHLYLQAMSQARENYGESWEQILGLVGLIQYFGGTADPLTAEVLSKQAGVGTFPTVQMNQNPGQAGMGNTYGLTGRPLGMPDEIMRVNLPHFLAFFVGEGVVIGRLIDPSLRDFEEYQLFMHGIKQGHSPEASAKAVCNMVDYKQRVAAAVRQAQPVSGPKRRYPFAILARFDVRAWLLKLRVPDRAIALIATGLKRLSEITLAPRPDRVVKAKRKPSNEFDPEEWVDKLFRKIMGHETK